MIDVNKILDIPNYPSSNPKYCLCCGKPVIKRHNRNAKFCSSECGLAFRQVKYKRKYIELNPSVPHIKKQGANSSVTGAISEHRVIIDLLSRGYEVYRAINSRSSCDLAILNNGGTSLKRVEVTTGHYSVSGNLMYPKHLKDRYDILAIAVTDKIIYIPEP